MNRFLILVTALICAACQSRSLPIVVPVEVTPSPLQDPPTSTVTLTNIPTQLDTPEPTSTLEVTPELSTHYTVDGTNPGDGTPYKGEASITRNGIWYDIVWTIGADTFKGFGILDGQVLFVRWIGPDCQGFGTATYNVQADGTLDGTWLNDGQDEQGTELLTPLSQ